MATDATGTPTTNYSIPKYDTANDAPSGLGFNAAMDAIDLALLAKVGAPSGIASGEVPVWNGSAWVRSSVTRVGASSLGSGSPSSTTYLRGDGTWAAVSAAPTGSIITSAAISTPSGYLACDGASVSKTTYADLWAAVSATKGTFTVTIASPGVVTLSSHGFVGGERVYLTTTGALPTGLAVDTSYYVKYVDANTFQLCSSETNWLAGTAINTSGTQSGTHTLVHAPYGVASSTNFYVPDLMGRMPVGKAVSGHSEANALGLDENETVANRRPKHKHTTNDSAGAQYVLDTNVGGSSNYTTGSYGLMLTPTHTTGPQSNTPTDAPAYLVVNFFIKT